MADGGVKKLTQITLGIDDVTTQLTKVKQELANAAQEINTAPAYKLKINLGETSTGTSTIDTVNQKLQSTSTVIKQLETEYGTLKNRVDTFNASGENTASTMTYVNDSLQQTVVKTKMVDDQMKVMSITQTVNLKTMNTQITTLTKGYQTLSDKIKSANSSTSNTEMLTNIQSIQAEITKIQTNASQTGFYSEADVDRIKTLETNLRTMNTEFKTANSRASNFLTTITDKARWLAAFYLIMQIKQAFTETLTTIRETETAVVELQRVLNEDVSSGVITDELYDLAIKYGRSIDEVSESAVKFAQTGADWADVLELVESTLLAVNTAELEVDDATTSLIAVISQFNLSAEEMSSIIDKINITADNFAVTSEKITDALVRSGGTASAFGLELEETIAAITALSEATGRAGTNIGTALNSLLTFSAKEGSLDTFAQLGGDVDEAVQKYRMGAASIIDVWTEVSKAIDGLNAQQASVLDQLLSSDDYSEFASELESEASDITDTIQKTYSSVGTYRQNYFIGLLGNLKTYQDALDGMLDSEGYSLEENAKVMDTLEARSQALSSSLKSLAADFGEEGGLDFLKTLTSWGQGVANLVDALGGIPTVLGVIATALMYIKAQQVGTALTKIGAIIPTVVTGIKNFSLYTKEAAVSMATFKASMGDILLVLSALNVVYQLFTAYQENVRQETLDGISASLDATKAYKEQSETLKTMTQSYKDAYEYIDGEWVATDKLNEVVETITDSYWLAKEARDALNGSYEEGIAVLQALTDEEYQRWLKDNLTDYKNAIKTISEESGTLYQSTVKTVSTDGVKAISQEALDDLAELEKYGLSIIDVFSPLQGQFVSEIDLSFSTQDVVKQIELLQNAMNILYQDAKDSGGWTANAELLFSSWSNEVDRLTREYSKLLDLIDEFEGTEAGNIFDDLTPTIERVIESGGSLEDVLAQVGFKLRTVSTDGVGTKEDVLALAEALFYATTNATGTADAMDALSLSTQSYTSLIADNYDKMKLVVDAQKELAESGYLSVGTVNDLYDTFDDLDGILELTEDGFVTTAGALDSLIDKQIEQANLELNKAKQAAVSFINAQGDKTVSINTETEALKENIKTKALLLAADMAMLRTVTYVEGDSAAGISYSNLEEYRQLNSQYKEIMGYYNDINVAEKELSNTTNLYNQIVRESAGASSSASSATDGLTDAQQAYVDSIEKSISIKQQELDLSEHLGGSYDDQISILKDLQAEQHRLAEYYRSIDPSKYAQEINDASLAWWGYQDAINALTETNLTDWQDKINTQIEENIKLLELQIDGVNDYYDKLIERLNETEEANDRLIAQQEYYDSLDDAKSSLAEASARSGVEYREEEADIMGEINDLQDDWQQQLDDWELEDQISALERARDNEIKALEKLIDTLEKSSGIVLDVDLSDSINAEEMLAKYQEQFGVPLSAYNAELMNEFGQLQTDATTSALQEILPLYEAEFLVPLAEDFNKLFVEDMSVLAIDSASIFLTAWQEGFINPVKQDLNGILSDFSLQANKAILTLASAQSSAMAQVAQATASAVNTTNNYNTKSTTNSVVNLNQTSSSNYNSLINSITTLP